MSNFSFPMAITVDTLHVRRAPGTGSDSVGFVHKGAQLTASDMDGSGTWLAVTGKKGVPSGWCSARYIQPVAASLPSWVPTACGEIGVKEYLGDDLNHPRIQQYLATVNGLNGHQRLTDETPWCSCFMNWCVEQAGLPGTDSASARSWANWRNPVALKSAELGQIAVFERVSPSANGGHVGIFIATDAAQTQILVLGGNQGNSVRFS